MLCLIKKALKTLSDHSDVGDALVAESCQLCIVSRQIALITANHPDDMLLWETSALTQHASITNATLKAVARPRHQSLNNTFSATPLSWFGTGLCENGWGEVRPYFLLISVWHTKKTRRHSIDAYLTGSAVIAHIARWRPNRLELSCPSVRPFFRRFVHSLPASRMVYTARSSSRFPSLFSIEWEFKWCMVVDQTSPQLIPNRSSSVIFHRYQRRLVKQAAYSKRYYCNYLPNSEINGFIFYLFYFIYSSIHIKIIRIDSELSCSCCY